MANKMLQIYVDIYVKEEDVCVVSKAFVDVHFYDVIIREILDMHVCILISAPLQNYNFIDGAI